MEQGYGCLACGGQHPVNWLITRLSPPQTVSSCEQDIEPALLALLAQRLDVPVEWLIDHINTGVDLVNREINEAAAEAEAAEKPRRRKARDRALVESAAVDGDDGSLVGFPEGYNEPESESAGA